jgi:uncharacterized membrane protein
MPSTKRAWTDDRMDQAIGQLLRAGVILSVTVVVIGAALYLIHHGGDRPDYSIFRGEPGDLRSLAGIVHGAAQLRPPYFIQLGLLLLIATPVARVAFSVFAFAAARDWTYVAITLIVLAILVANIVAQVGSARA